jgi:DNA-binding protein H-NS
MAVNLKTLSATELQTLIQDASAYLEGARKNLVKDIKAKIDALLQESGLTLDDVYQRRAAKHTKGSKSHLKGSTVAPKYRNPEDPAQTWTGRGRQPAWFAAALKKRGVTEESLLIGGGKATTKKATKKTTKKIAKKAVKKAARRKAKA